LWSTTVRFAGITSWTFVSYAYEPCNPCICALGMCIAPTSHKAGRGAHCTFTLEQSPLLPSTHRQPNVLCYHSCMIQIPAADTFVVQASNARHIRLQQRAKSAPLPGVNATTPSISTASLDGSRLVRSALSTTEIGSSRSTDGKRLAQWTGAGAEEAKQLQGCQRRCVSAGRKFDGWWKSSGGTRRSVH